MKRLKPTVRLLAAVSLGFTALTLVSANSSSAQAAGCPTNTLYLGQVLKENGDCYRLTSAGGHYTLFVSTDDLSIMQSLTPTGTPAGQLTTMTGSTWSVLLSGNNYYGIALGLRDDGNLVLVTPTRQLIWSSNTAGKGVTRAVMSDNGRLMLLNAQGRMVWSSDSGVYALGVGDKVLPGGSLVASRHFTPSGPSNNSNARRSVGTMQSDGNFVFRCGYPLQQVWQSNTHVPGSYMTMLSNGQLIIKVPGGRIVWSTPTRGASDAFSILGVFVSSNGGYAWRAWDYPNGTYC